MAIPDYQSIMLPLLEFASDKKEHSTREAIEFLSDHFQLTEEERKKLLPSGQQYVFENRVGWAKTYLTKAGLLESPRRSFFKITERGLKVLSQNPKEINVEFLAQFPEFVEFRTYHREKEEDQKLDGLKETPRELLEYAYQKINEELAQELLSKLKEITPRFFEIVVVDLLIKMGYGGSSKDAGEAIGQSGDGGIDGIIKQDRLGIDVVYIQAKRWKEPVGVQEIRNFVGSLAGRHANKGIFITTSRFTEEALNYIKNIPHKVVLIDGERLAQLMIEFDVGVTQVSSYHVKRIDSDYFEES